MSWIFGFISEMIPDGTHTKLPVLHPPPLYHYSLPTFYLAAGGIPQTCLSMSEPSSGTSFNKGWVVVGLGIRRINGGCKFLDQVEWNEILRAETPDLSNIDGHFIVVRWYNQRIECYADQLGMRTLYLASVEGGTVFSTRQDWIARLRTDNTIDFREFGSQWLTFNQLSYRSVLTGIHRLGPGGVAICTAARIEVKNKPFEKLRSEGFTSVGEVLSDFLHPELNQDTTCSLGLSGGLDSRLLFGLLIAENRRDFSLHLFGDPEEPDVQIAKQLAQDYRVEQIYFPETEAIFQNDLDVIREFVAKTSLALPVSSFAKLRFYSRLHQLHKIMIDGGMGEIGRRQFLNRLYFKSSRTKITNDPASIRGYIGMHHVSIFTHEIDEEMEKGVAEQVSTAWAELSPDAHKEYGDLLDLFVIRYRFPNYAGYDQSRLDEEIVNYMPFAQPSVIRAFLGMPVDQRRNGEYFRKTIRSIDSSLIRYPLVKGNTTYPFKLPTLPAWIYTNVKDKIGFSYRPKTRDLFLQSMKNYVYEIVESQDVRTWAPYDHGAIVRFVDRYYNGEKSSGQYVDWFLTFELWRQVMRIR